MTLGVGLSIGTVNSVLALTTDDAEPRLRSCRTAAEIGDGADGPRAERFPSAALVGAFTDQGGVPGIANRTDPGAAAELVAAMTRRLLTETETDAAMLACPAVCSVVESAALRTALDAAGLPRVELTSEPVAAATWLQSRSPEGDADLVLVYDLGGSSLDIAVVRRDPDTDRYRLVGRAARTHEFSGRAFTAAVARYAHDTTADAGCPGHMQAVPNDDVVRLRCAWIHASVPLVRECVRVAGVSVAELDRILLVGGAVRPAEVARVLADALGVPVVTAPDPASCVAIGAALLAARSGDPATVVVAASRVRNPGKRIALFAAVASVVATAAMFGPRAVHSIGPQSDSPQSAQAGPSDRLEPGIRSPAAMDSSAAMPPPLPHTGQPEMIAVDWPAPSSAAAPDSTPRAQAVLHTASTETGDGYTAAPPPAMPVSPAGSRHSNSDTTLPGIESGRTPDKATATNPDRAASRPGSNAPDSDAPTPRPGSGRSGATPSPGGSRSDSNSAGPKSDSGRSGVGHSR